jgi:uncharacterized protein YndB with AHSA1/START domain
MRYTQEIVIDAPRDTVVALFTDPSGFKEWQPGLECYELVSGEQAQTGAKAELTTRAGSRVTGMTETVEDNSLPDEMSVVYETHGVWNRSINRFSEESPASTKWVSDNEFRFEGARKLLGLMEGSFEKESRTTMELFKAFVEKSTAP